MSEANLDPNTLWTHVKAARSEFRERLKHSNIDYSNYKFETWCTVIISDEEIWRNFYSLSKKLQVKVSFNSHWSEASYEALFSDSVKVKNMSKSIIDSGGEMFVYLNSCPSIHWQKFYHHLVYEQPNPKIILAVLNAMKNSNTRGSKLLANKVFGRLANILGFEYNHYQNDRKWIKSIAKVKGEQTS